MTVAVAVRRPWGVALASDSLIAAGDLRGPEYGRKLFRVGTNGVAGAGLWRTIQRAQESLPQTLAFGDLMGLLREMRHAEWLVTDGARIVCVGGGSYTNVDGYGAIGSGSGVALGALHATGSPTAAVKAAAHHVASCGGAVQRMRVRAAHTNL